MPCPGCLPPIARFEDLGEQTATDILECATPKGRTRRAGTGALDGRPQMDYI